MFCSIRKNLQIALLIVFFVPVDVMNNLRGKQRTAELRFCNHTVGMTSTDFGIAFALTMLPSGPAFAGAK